MLSLAWQTIRGRRAGFVAAFVAVFCGAALLTACGVFIDSGLRAGVPPERYAGAAVVVGANQSLPTPQEAAQPYAERVPLPATDVARIAKVPGVKAAIGDTSVPIAVPTGESAKGLPPIFGHGWSSATLAPLTLTAGHAPQNPDEIVLEAALANEIGAHPGTTLKLVVGGLPLSANVVGLAAAPSDTPARQDAVYFPDQQAAALSGRAAQVDAIGVLAAPGVTADELAGRIHAALPNLKTYTGNDRADAEFLDVGQARSFLLEISGAFGGTMVMIVLFVVAATLGLGIQQRRREFALLRAIAATPRQVHRLVGAETYLLSTVAAVLGTLPGYGLSFLLRNAFATIGVVPADFDLVLDPVPALAAIVACVLTGRLAGLIAARRVARISPVDALGEAAVEPAKLGRIRVGIGWLLVVLALGASVVVPLLVPGEAGISGAAGAALLLVIAVALLGPRLLAMVGGLAGRLRLTTGGFLAAANTQANARRLSAAGTPLILGVTLAAVQVFTVTTMGAAAQHQAETGVVADYVLTSPLGGVAPQLTGVATGVPGVAAVTPVARTQVLATFHQLGNPTTESFTTQGVTADRLDSVLNLDVRQGNLAALTGNTVALSQTTAATIGVKVGGTLALHLGDGTVVTPRVIAIYGNGLGFGDVTLPNDVVIAHTTTRLDAAVLVRVRAGADPAAVGAALRAAVRAYPTVTVADRTAFVSAQNAAGNGQSLVNLLLDGVFLGYIAIAVANTLVMATAARGREFALLRLVGAGRRQVRAMMRAEARILIVTAVVVGSAAALPPLVGVSLGLTGSPLPSVPLWPYLGIVAGAALLGWASITIPTRVAMRPRPVLAISIRE
ncbi:MAG TPA: ABC transporter permease [Pseudonocardiaceae bacterium]|jgi:putative ABC transport system permease protein|nr:ABC transporter permease [Pseudonocardiaceae bacterium]